MKIQLAALCCLFATCLAEAQRDIVIYPRPREDTKLAVADFVVRTAPTSDTEEALKIFNQVLWTDLTFSAFFQMPSKSFYPLKSIRSPQEVDFANWQVPTLDADFLIFGNLQVDSGRAVVESYLYDVKTQEQVLGKRYTISDAKLIRRVAHEFADQVVFQLSAGASKGVALTRISFASDKGGMKEIQVMDYDGFDPRSVTANGGLNKFPSWSADGTQLAFVTKLPGVSRWELWVQGLTGGHQAIRMPTSYVSSPAFSSDGNRIAFSTREPNRLDADIYVSATDGTQRRNITYHPAIDTSPTWSPRGQQLAFISDRTGTPQVWIMDADGSNVQRLVTEGGHCDSPEWSPDGRFIAYSWQAPTQVKHDIYIVEVATLRIFQLTSGRGSNESPTWSPDGRHVAFQSTRTGTKQIFVMNADGQNLRQLTVYGINGSPSWSGYPATE